MCDSNKTKNFENLQYSRSIADRLYELKLRKKYCDVEIILNGKKYFAHSNILAACSEYFESKIDEIQSCVKQIIISEDNEHNAAEKLIRYCYTGTIEITSNSVKSIANMASIFQLEKVVHACCDFWKTILDTKNCLNILKTVKYLCENFHEEVLSFVCYNLEEVTNTISFLLIEFDTLIDILKFDMSDMSEAKILTCIKNWIEHDVRGRSRYLHSIFEFTKLPLLPPEHLLEAKSLCKLESQCESLVTEALQWQLLTSSQNKLKSFRTRPRKPASTLLVVGCWDGTIAPKIEIYNPVKQEWFEFMDLKFNRRHFRAVFYDGKLIIIGGLDNNAITNLVQSLNLETRKITNMDSLHEPKGFTAVAVLGNAIYVAGGHGPNGPSNSVEKWSKETQKWIQVTPMMNARDGCHAVVLNDEMYVVGGFNVAASSVTEAYSPNTGQWRQCASMNVARMYPGLAASNGFIYVIGGRVKNHHITERFSSVEKYDPVANKWTFVANISDLRYGITAEEFDGKIFAVGGASDGNVLKDVEIYDPEKNEWCMGPKINFYRESPSVVRVPWKIVKNKSECT